ISVEEKPRSSGAFLVFADLCVLGVGLPRPPFPLPTDIPTDASPRGQTDADDTALRHCPQSLDFSRHDMISHWTRFDFPNCNCPFERKSPNEIKTNDCRIMSGSKPLSSEFRSILQSISGRYDTRRVFEGFVRLAACALAAQTREPEYLEEVKRWNKSDLEL